MKKLIIKIGNETHELPYNNEAYSVEVIDKYVPKVGDCVKVECININKTTCYWFKVQNISKKKVEFSLVVGEDLNVLRNGYFNIDIDRIYTKITSEELKAKYAEAGYEWDYDTDTIKPLKWLPKDGDFVWCLNTLFGPVKYTFDKYSTFLKLMLEKDLLFKTEEESQKFSNYCLEYFKK